MASLAPHADQAVRHAVDAYIDGRLIPTFEGDSSFETRNSQYRLSDGVLFSAPDDALVGAELVGWLVEYVSRSEVVPQWKAGARAVLVDTRNDGVRGPHIVVTSATRSFRGGRPLSAPALVAAPPPHFAPNPTPFPPPRVGSSVPQVGSTMPPPPTDLRQSLPRVGPSWETLPPPAPVPSFAAPKTLPPPPPLPTYRQRPATIPPPPMVNVTREVPHSLPRIAPPPPPRPLPRALPPMPLPLPPPAFADEVAARKIAAAIEASYVHGEQADDAAPTVRNERSRSSSRLSHGRAPTRPALPPPPASVPFLLSRAHSTYDAAPSMPLPPRTTRSHQRGLPLR